MKSLLARIAILALPALLAVGCGGDDLFGTLDGGSTGTCPTGTTLFRIQDGAYSSTAATIISDTCNSPPLNSSEVMGVRNVMNNTSTGTITVTGTGGSIIGAGPLRCNTGTISASMQVVQAPCQYLSSRTSVMTITGDSNFTLDFTDSQSDFASSGGTCTQTQACTTHFSLTMQHQ